MVGDRRLTDAEVRVFITERTPGEFDALAALREVWLQKGEPTLHDLAIMELLARFEAWDGFLKEYAARVDALMKLHQGLRVRMDDLEAKFEAK